jgi:hypothetical protein
VPLEGPDGEMTDPPGRLERGEDYDDLAVRVDDLD